MKKDQHYFTAVTALHKEIMGYNQLLATMSYYWGYISKASETKKELKGIVEIGKEMLSMERIQKKKVKRMGIQ